MLIIDVHEGETVEQAETRQRAAEKRAADASRPRVVFDMPRDEYDRLPRVNYSRLKNMAKSPAHYRHALLAEDVDSAAKKRGRAVHVATLEPERFRSEFVVYPGRRAGKAWEEFEAAHDGLEILSEKEHADCLAIQRAVRGNASALKWIEGGRGEVSMLWTHTESAVGALPGFKFDCKGRVDFLSRAIADLKTTRDASPEGFGREVYRYRYHVQAAFYVDGYAAITGERLPYVIVAVESAPPHVVQVYILPDHVIEQGREEYRALLSRLEVCRSESRWPGYSDAELELVLPRWANPGPDDDDASGLDLDLG